MTSKAIDEEAAREKRCCGPNGCGQSRDDLSGSPDNAPRYCIASACMAWCESWKDYDKRTSKNNYQPVSVGFCGLAHRS